MADSNKTLKILIELGYIGADKAEAAKQALASVSQVESQSNAESAAGSAAATKAAGEEVESTHSLELHKRELLESVRQLTSQYPILGEAIRGAFNPAILTITSLVFAAETLREKLDGVGTAFGAIDLPEFGDHIKEVEGLGQAYHGVADAILEAVEQFDSATAAYDRQAKSIQAIAGAIRAQIAAQKEKQIADLDIQRADGHITPGQYAVQKAIIEQGYTAQTTQAEIDQRNADLAARKEAAAKAAQDAEAKEAAANNFKLPEDNAAVDAQIAEQKARAAALRKQAEENRKEAERAGRVAENQQGGKGLSLTTIRSEIAEAPEEMAFGKEYGAIDANQVQQANTKAAAEAEEQARAAERAAHRIEEQKALRDKLRKEAEAAAAKAVDLNAGIEGEDDPKKPGSVAWQNAQALKTQGTRSSAAERERFASDVERFSKDAATYQQTEGKADPQSVAKARAAMVDMAALVKDAIGIIRDLGATGENVAELRRELEHLKSQSANTRNSQGGQG